MGKDYYGYHHGVSKANTASGGNGKRTGGGSGKGDGGGKVEGGAGGRGYSGYLGVSKTSAAGNIRKDYHKQPEKNPRGNKEAERRSEQSSRSYDNKVVHGEERRPAYDNHRRAAEEKPKEKLASSDDNSTGWCPYHPWIGGPYGEKDYGVTDDSSDGRGDDSHHTVGYVSTSHWN